MPATRPGPVEVPTEIDVHVPDGATPGTKLRCALSWGQYILVTVRATKRNYLSMVIGRYISSHLPVALTAVPVAPAIPASFLHCIPCAGATKCYCRPNLYRATAAVNIINAVNTRGSSCSSWWQRCFYSSVSSITL